MENKVKKEKSVENVEITKVSNEIASNSFLTDEKLLKIKNKFPSSFSNGLDEIFNILKELETMISKDKETKS